jgi:hypothetical protein
MKKNDYLYRVADLYCAHGERLLALGIGDGMAPAGEREQIAKIKREIDSYNWSGGTESLEEFEAGFNKFLTICEYLAIVPSPVGNPFSIALVGEDLAQGDYSSAALNLLGGLPWLSILKKGGLIVSIVNKVLRVCPAVIRPGVQMIALWIANSMDRLASARVAVYGTIIAVRGLMEKLPSDLLVNTARRVASGGFASSLVKKPVEDKNFNAADAALYLSDFLMKQAASEIAGIAAEVRSAVS